MQAQGNSQGIPALNELSSAYPNHSQRQQTPPQQSSALIKSHHASGSQQQAYVMHFAKERKMQPQQLHMHQQHQPQQQQQQQLAASSTLMPHVQPQSQLPMSSLQNSSQIQSQASKQPVSLPLTPSSPIIPISMQNQQKHHLSPHGLGRNPQPGASVLNNQIGKQRQHQPLQQQQFQQSGRHHPQHRQQTQSQQQAKLLKGVGREPVHRNDVSMAPGNQGAETGELMMQGQGLYSGPGVRAVQPSKSLVSSQPLNHSQPQQKSSGTAAPSTIRCEQTQLSVSLHPHGSNDGEKWSQQPQIQQSPTPPPSEQHYQPQEQLQQDQHNSPPQLPLQQQPQQQTLHLQAVQSSLYHRPRNSKLE